VEESYFDIDLNQLPVGLAPPRPRITSGTRPTVTSAPSVSQIPQGYARLGSAIDSYQNALSSGADYFDIGDVDLVDQYYDDIFRDTLATTANILSDFDIIGGEAGIIGGPPPSDTIRVDRNTYFSQVDAPDYLRNFRAPTTQESAVSAYSSIANLQNTSDIASALSNYYGYEITPAEQNLGRFGGNLQSHTGTSKARLAEFHSLVEPILSEQLPYLQTVEGLSYEDALIESYKRDPMLQSLYAKYDVSPIRQTKDGSTYLYDPFTFGEIRTLEVKDPSIGDIVASVLPTLALSTILGPLAGTAAGTVTTAGTSANAALTAALTSAATAGLQGADLEDALKAGLISGGLTYAGDAISGLREGGQAGAINPSAPELTFDPRDPTVPNNIIDIAGDPSAFEGIDIRAFTPEVAQSITDIQYRALDDVINRLGGGAEGSNLLNRMTNEQLANNLRAAGDIEGLNALGLGGARTTGFFPSFTDLRQDLLQEYITSTGPTFAPDVIGGRTTDNLLIDRPPAVREYQIEDLITEPERITERPIRPTQMPGGGGGASGGAASAPATSVVSPSAPSATVTPVVPQPTFAAPGSITSSLFSSFAPALAAAAVVAPQPTVAPPITPVATTAPTSEPTPPTTTQPTDILEDTTAEDTTAQMEAEAEAQRQAEAEAQRQAEAEAQRQAQEEAQRQAQAEAARLAEEARKAAEARAAAEAKAAAEQEAIAQAEARAEAAEARLAEQQAQAQADAAAAEAARAADAQAQADALAEAVAAGEARYGEAVAAGEALGEAKYGEGLGTGRGQGAGAGIGAGLGLGLLAGMGGGAGGTGGYTPPDFEDYQFRKTYQAPELLELAPQYEGYQAPTLQGLFRGFI
jgi:hypothetical protein